MTVSLAKVSGQKRRVRKPRPLIGERRNERIGSLHSGIEIDCLKGDRLDIDLRGLYARGWTESAIYLAIADWRT
jgi:hypothetical protein